MAFPGAPDPASLPMHVLFPEDYAKSRDQTIKDLALMGCTIACAIVLGATFAAYIHL